MEIVSHNTMSYLKPIHWYDRLFSRWSKCQDKTLHEQYKSGIRWFDIRIRKIKDKWVIVHNTVIYGYSDWIRYIFQYLNETKEQCHIRLIYDDRRHKTKEQSDICTEDFKNLIKQIKEEYPNVDIYETITYWNWTFLNTNKDLYTVEKHASVCLPLLKYILFGTKWFASKYNIDNMTKYSKNNSCLLFLDFV